MRKIMDWLGRALNLGNRLPSSTAILTIVLLSLGVKLAYITLLGGGLAAFPREGSDVYFYDGAARALLQNGVYGVDPSQPTTEMPPGQPVFLAALYGLSGYSIAFAKLGHIALLTAVAVLTYLTGAKLFSPAVGFWGGVLIAIDPAQAYLAGTFLSEPLFIFLIVLGLYSLLLGTKKPASRWWLVGAGVCFGLAGLTRNQGWAFPVALMGGAAITFGRLIPVRVAALVLAVTAITIAPWTYRNYRLTGQIIPVSSEGGLTFWASNNPEFVYRPPMPMSLPVYAAPPGLSQTELNRYYWDRTWVWIASHPVDFVVNDLRKLVALYHFDPLSWRPEVSLLFRLAGLFPYGLMLPFIVLAAIEQIRNPRLWLIFAYILYSTLLAMLFYGDSRIRAPIQPYLYLFGAAWLVDFSARLLKPVSLKGEA